MKTIAGLFSLMAFALLVMAVIGWFKNVIALCHLDFEAPYKSEVLRGAGVFMPPVGGIMGYVTFDEEAGR